MRKKILDTSLAVLFSAVALSFAVLTFIGTKNGHSPVPFWDMWNGYLDFYVHAASGDWSAWWAQHNEHRVVLARIFFWMDLAWFRGTSAFLLLVNYLLVCLTAWIFWCMAREQTQSRFPLVGLFLMAWVFSWAQKENMVWGFQSQFILAQLLPLAAFYFLHRAANTPGRPLGPFVWAVGLGVLSIGSMANGVLALPLMTLYALIVRFSWRRIGLLALLSVLGVAAYFHGYEAPPAHGSLGQALRDNPEGLVRYVLLYLGAPLYTFQPSFMTEGMAQWAGAFLILSCVGLTWRALRRPQESTLSLALLMFLLYIGGTALGTAGGRLIFGLSQALASRYMTPVLMAWGALFLLYVPCLRQWPVAWRLVWVPLLILVCWALPVQLNALKPPDSAELYERRLGAFALALGVRDSAQIETIFPSSEQALVIAEVPVQRQLSIFGRAPLKGLRALLDTPVAPDFRQGPVCAGHLDIIRSMDDEQRYHAIRGWFYDPHRQAVPPLVYFVNEHHRIVGFALSGMARPDVASAVTPSAGQSGWRGYLAAQENGRKVTMLDPSTGCHTDVNVPNVLFKIQQPPKAPQALPITVDLSAVQANNQWLGGDFYGSQWPDTAVLGSYVHSDADVGEIRLRLRRGDKLLYRSGPTGSAQRLRIEGFPVVEMPVALEWIVLDFSQPQLPDEFTTHFTDEGPRWGEWSAIAVKKKN